MPHQYLDLGILIQEERAFSPPLLYVLSERHIHLLKNYVELAVLELDALGLHDIWAMHFSGIFINVIESLQNLYFSLVKSLLFRGELVLELFNREVLASFDMLAFENVSKRPSADQLSLFVFIPNNEFMLLRRAITSSRPIGLRVVIVLVNPNHERRSLVSLDNRGRASLLLIHWPHKVVFYVLLNRALSFFK